MDKNNTELPTDDSTEDSEDTKHVHFSTIDVFVFQLTAGDNPSVSKGPPTQIEWSHIQAYHKLNLDQFERTRGPAKSLGRFSRSKRVGILKDQGVSSKDIREAERLAMHARDARKDTILNMKHQRQQERRESFRHLFSREKGPDVLKDYVFAPRLSSANIIEDIPCLCPKCAVDLLYDTTTTKVIKCKNECTMQENKKQGISNAMEGPMPSQNHSVMVK